ncbi:MAG TPA: discoidin domain-containing protein [Chitinophaga sp.]|uniref:discoidin domain-containing protein n=1 Tax=Chitinophaga sp. TaxID=1869181 RepID=UPI002DC013BA|nr:discoidin domain-containing protein [Chitinophaga sp.]HEU4552955.1 discoidin domain-containing protein [Chitinophaga sp.]
MLNFPVDRRGLIHETDEKAVLALAKAVKEAFAVNLAEKKKVNASNVRGNAKAFGAGMAVDGNKNTYWATDDAITDASLTINFGKPTTFNRFLVQEYIRLGQRVKAFKVEGLVNGSWKELANGTTIGYKRILLFPAVTATQLRFTITGAKSCPLISNIGVYNAPPVLVAPQIIRDQSGTVYIRPADKESVIYYTLDGSQPTKEAKRYKGPVQTDGKVNVKAIVYDPISKKSSAVAGEKFDISRKDWKISGINDDKVNRVIDGDPATAWYQERDTKLPADIDIDMGKMENIAGFKYLPGQDRTEGIITHYQFWVSEDNKDWKIADEGEFSNIKNNPLLQVKEFKPVKARYIRLRALHNTQQNNAAGYAELDVITH